MTTSLYEYEQIYNNAIFYGTRVLDKIKEKISGMDEVDVDLADTDYNGLIWKLEKTLSSLEKQRVRYLYDKMSREEFDLVLKNRAEGKPSYLITVGQPHKLRSIDTLQLLSVLYNSDAEYLLSYNGISPKEFEEKKERNDEIKIPVVVNIKDKTNYSDIAVFGSMSGRKAWGVDLPNEMVVKDGDYALLSEERTLAQGVDNRFGMYGDIPAYENESIDLDWGKDFNPQLVELITVVKVSQKLLIDARVKEVKDVRTTRVQNGLLVENDIVPVNSDEPISIKINGKENTENPLGL